jgi:hypothetical protein
MSRTQWILAIALIVQLALLGVLYLGSDKRAGDAQQKLLPQVDAFTPDRILIDARDEEEPLSLERRGEGWTLGDPAGYPVDAAKVDGLLDKLEELSIRRPVVSSSRYHAALKVSGDEHERRLRIWDSDDDDPKVDLYLGTSPNFDISHVRLGGDDRVYEVRGLGSFDLRAELSAWVEREFIDLAVDDVVSLKLRNAHGEIELANENGSWSLLSPIGGKDGQADAGKIDSYVRSVCSVFLSEPAGRADDPALGLDDPAAELEIRFRAGDGAEEPAIETLRLVVGAEAEGTEGERFASRSGFDHAVVLSRYDAEKFTEKKIADLYPDPE